MVCALPCHILPHPPFPGTPMKPLSTLHLPSRLSWPVRVESGLLPSLLVKCVCSQDTEEAQDVIIHDQTSSQGRPSLPPSVPMKLPFYTHLPLRPSWPLRMSSGHLPSFLTTCVCSQALEDALGDNITDQSHQKVVHNFPP